MGRPTTKTLVVGGRMQEAEGFIRDLGLDPRAFRASFDPVRDMRGCRDLPIILVGTYTQRRDYDAMMLEIELRNCHICAKIEDW